MAKAATTREQRANQKFEQAARKASRGTPSAREDAARLIAHANAVKARRPVPEYAGRRTEPPSSAVSD